MDLDKWIAKVKGGEYLAEDELKALCDFVKEVLVEESNVQPVNSPVTVCGDIHGQFHDMLKLFETGGQVPTTNYIFMGDFVDRGYNSLEVFTLLMLLKARYPAHVTLLRGNHESRQITQASNGCTREGSVSSSSHQHPPYVGLQQVYGFYDECHRKYGNANAWRYCTEVFDYLTLSAIIDGRVLCVHGGLSPDLRTLDQARGWGQSAAVRVIDRICEIPHEGPFCDLMWSDPEDIDTWAVSPRGAGACQGAWLRCAPLVVRLSQERSLVTVWSAPNYCYRCGNVASILCFDSQLQREVRYFTETEENSNMTAPRAAVPYFL
eukprot:scaffold8.g1652.t1